MRCKVKMILQRVEWVAIYFYTAVVLATTLASTIEIIRHGGD